MSHETHHSHTSDNSPKTSYTSAFWFVIILAGLFIGAVNFVNVMGHDEGHAPAGHEAAHHNEELGGSIGPENNEMKHTATAADSTQRSGSEADTTAPTEPHSEAH